MPHIEPLSDDQATEAAKNLFQPLQSALGMVPNIFRTMAHAPDVRELLRGGSTDDQIAETVRRAVHAKKSGHGIDTDEFIKPERAMYQIGG